MSVDLDSKVRAIAKSGGFLFGGMVIEFGVSFLAKVIIARYLEPAEFGVIALGVTILTMASTLALVGLETGIARFAPRFDDERQVRGVLVSGFQIAIPLALVSGAVVILSAPILASQVFDDRSLVPVIRLFGAAVPLAVTLRLVIGSGQGLQRTLPKVLFQNVTLPVSRLLGFLVVIALGMKAVGVAAAYLFAYAAAAATGLVYIARSSPLFSSTTGSVPKHRELLTFSLPLVIGSAMSFVFADIDTLMLGYFTTSADIGIYNVVYPVAQILGEGVIVFSFLFLPIISELHAEAAYEEMRRLYQVLTKWIVVATLPMFLIVLFFPESTIRIVFGAKYEPGALALSVLSLGFFSSVIGGLNAETLTSIGRTKLVMYDNGAVAIVNIVLNLVLIPRYSFLGAAVATSIAYILQNVLFSVQLYQHTGIHPFTKALVQPSVVALVLVGAIYGVIITFFQVTVVTLVAFFLVFMAVYAVAILRFGGIEEQEVMLVLSFEERLGVDLGPVKRLGNWFIRD